MRSLALVVPRAEAEEARRHLKEVGALRGDLDVIHEGEMVVFPLGVPIGPLRAGWEAAEREFNTSAAVPQSYRELLRLPDGLQDSLPRAFDVVGDIVLVRLPPELEPSAREVGTALLRFVPGARLVGWDHGIHGVERRRRLTRIAGVGGWQTRHRENGLVFDVDVEGAYFSPRLAREHDRVAELVQPGERVLDLCCGIGPFALTIASRGRSREVVAVDVNPRAIELLRANILRLGFSGRIRAIEGTIEGYLPSAGASERAVLNLPHEGIKYLIQVGAAVEQGGTLHYYEVTDRDAVSRRPSELETMMRPEGGWTVESYHVVHPYSPQSDLVAYTISRRRPGGG